MPLLAGAAKVDITPLKPVPLAGMVAIRDFAGGPPDHQGYVGRTGDSHGIEYPVNARVVVFSESDTTAVLVALDLCIVTASFTQRVRSACQDRWGLDPCSVIVTASHSHAGPDYLGFWEECDPDIEGYVLELTLSAIGQALACREPVRVGNGGDMLGELVINRRDPARPVDPRISILRAESESGRTVAIIYIYACHPIVIGSHNRRISSDFPGYASELIETTFGGGAVALFLNGAAGNINPVAFPYSERRNISSVVGKEAELLRTHAEAERFGRVLGGRVVSAAAKTPCRRGHDVKCLRASVPAPLKTGADLDKYFHHWSIRATAPERLRIANRKAIETEVMALRIADTILLFLPGEPFVEIAFALENVEVDQETALRVIGYANDYPGYVLRKEDYAENRYETVATCLAEAGSEMVMTVACKIRDRLLAEIG